MTLFSERKLLRKLIESGEISSLAEFTELVSETLRKYTEEEDIEFTIHQTHDNILKVKTSGKKFKITIRDITPKEEVVNDSFNLFRSGDK